MVTLLKPAAYFTFYWNPCDKIPYKINIFLSLRTLVVSLGSLCSDEEELGKRKNVVEHAGYGKEIVVSGTLYKYPRFTKPSTPVPHGSLTIHRQLGKWSNYCMPTWPTILQKDRWSLMYPPLPSKNMVSCWYSPDTLSGVETEKYLNLPLLFR